MLRKNKILSVVLVFTMVLIVGLAGCGKKEQKETTTDTTQDSASNETKDTTKEEKVKDVTLKMLIHDDFQYEYITELNSLSDAYKKVKPNVTIEVEKVKDSGQLEEALKIRNSANELPDLMMLKPYMLSSFAEVLAPLNDTSAAKNNKFAEQYAVDGTVVGVPESAFYEFVYYRKSVFEEYGLEIPDTWDKFIATAEAIKEKGEYIPIVLGAKDSWPDYPFNEFMPCLEAGDGQLWNIMATQDEPFTEGKPFYEAYKKIQKLYDADIFGKDPLGMGFDQAKSMFVAKKGAMIAAGQWFINDYTNMDGDMADLGLFLLPVRSSESDPFYATVMADGFFATPKENENVSESIAFMEWYFESDYYKEYLMEKGINPTANGVEIDMPLLNEPFERIDATFIVYDGGNKDFKKITDSFGFDVKRLGQEMLSGKDFNKMMSELNAQWKAARGN